MSTAINLVSDVIIFTLFPLVVFNIWAFIFFHVSNGFLDEKEKTRNLSGFLIGLFVAMIVVVLDSFNKGSTQELPIHQTLLRVGIYIAAGFILGILIDKFTDALDKRNLTAISIAFFTLLIIISIYDLIAFKDLRYAISFGFLGWIGYLVYMDWSEKKEFDSSGSFLDGDTNDPSQSETETPNHPGARQH
ncbi:MAG: hypothetical protein ACM3PS_06395 [Syntrophothermus sp.]